MVYCQHSGAQQSLKIHMLVQAKLLVNRSVYLLERLFLENQLTLTSYILLRSVNTSLIYETGWGQSRKGD